MMSRKGQLLPFVLSILQLDFLVFPSALLNVVSRSIWKRLIHSPVMSGWIILTSFFVWIPNHLVSAHEYNYYKTATHTSADVDAIREKWGVNEIVRDLDHIREDISKVLKMEQTGLISTKEAIFYFFKMHDFDNNEKLDGLEYLVAISHSMEHVIDISTEDLDEISRAIDLFLSYDGNSDGFISYYEYKQHLNES